MKKTVRLFSIVLLIFSFHCQANDSTEVKNIILMIGDGMGIAQIYAGYTANKGHLNLEKSQFSGFSITYSADQYITDSGAGATAISTGKKTCNYTIGVNCDGKAMKTILESAEEKGLSTGMVVTCAITNATPAAFIAHQSSREENIDIARDFIGSDIDIFIGGGKQFFEDPKQQLNVSDSLRKTGYDIVYRLEDIKTDDNKNTGCLLAEDYLPKMTEGRGNYLVEATNIALSRLSQNENGFFLMVEGSQIDWGGHSNDVVYVSNEVIDLDRAVGEAFKFADQHPGTLVIVTADHETGGLTITGGNILNGNVEGNFSTTGHTGLMVPVFAYGTGAHLFTGMYQNTDLYFKMMKLLNLAY